MQPIYHTPSEPRRTKASTVFGVIIFLFIAFSLIQYASDDPRSAGTHHSMVGEPAPEIIAAHLDAPDQEVRTTLPSGDGLTLVEFWSSTCGPCRANRPEINRVAEAFPSMEIISVNLDAPSRNRLRVVESYVAEHSVPGTVVLDEGATSVDWGVRSIPATFVVDGNGQIARVLNGRFRARDVIPSIRSLTDEPG